MCDPWAWDWNAVAALSAGVAALATIALVVTAAITIPMTAKATTANTEALRIQNQLLELETNPVLVLVAGNKIDFNLINHWMIIAPRPGGLAEGATLEGYISKNQVIGNPEFVGIGHSPQVRSWEIIDITNSGRSAAVRGKIKVKLVWGTATIDANEATGVHHEQHLADGTIDVPACPAGGHYRVGIINQTGIDFRILEGDKPSFHRPTERFTETPLSAVVPVPITVRSIP